MNQEHYLNYAVYMTSHGDYLVKVTGGYFASDAWMKGDEAFGQVLGNKFGGIFGDDGKHAHCNKCNVRRLTSDEEFEQLFASAHPAFKFAMKCLDIFDELRKREMDQDHKINLYEALAKFKMETCILPEMLQKFPDITPEKYVKMYVK